MQKKNGFRWLCNVALILFLLSALSFSAQAQIRLRTPNDSILAQLNKVWFTTARYQFHQSLPILTAVPPLTTSMPYDILLSYIYLDSLCRNITPALLSNYCNGQTTKNDTMVLGVKYLYLLSDYDPIHLIQYGKDVDLKIYHTSPNLVYARASDFVNKATLKMPNHQVLNDLMECSYILKVHVNSISTMPWIGQQGKYVYQVNATVVDTLHGKVFPNSGSIQPNLINTSPNTTMPPTSTIYFNYVTGPYSNINTNRIIDNSLKNSSGNLTLQPGQDLIVSLEIPEYLWDYKYDYFTFNLVTVIPVINGEVIDHAKEWSNTEILDYADWKNAFQNKVNILLNGGY